MKSIARLMIAALATAAIASCSSAQAKECHTQGQAAICLVTMGPHLYQPTASGLKPGTSARVHLAGPHLDSGEGLPLLVDSAGHLPGAQGVIVPAGAGPTTITITATSASGATLTATFTR